jgi:hypothetical protein
VQAADEGPLSVTEAGPRSAPSTGRPVSSDCEPPIPERRRRALPRLGQLAVLVVIVVALVVGVVLIVKGSQSHEPAAAPLPSTTFQVPPGQLAPTALPPLVSGQLPTVSGNATVGGSAAVGGNATATVGGSATATVGGSAPGAGTAAPGGGATGECTLPVQPAHVVIGSLCVNGPIVTTAVTPEGALIIPADVHQIGMWDKGAAITGPDQQPLTQGTTLLAGHVNAADQGSGAFYDLYKVQPGAVVYVADPAGGVTRWRVVGLDVVVKAALPKSVFAGPTGPRKLVLVTCGGPIMNIPGVGNTYRDNVIVSATPA